MVKEVTYKILSPENFFPEKITPSKIKIYLMSYQVGEGSLIFFEGYRILAPEGGEITPPREHA